MPPSEAPNLKHSLRAELQRFAPFAQMADEDVDAFAAQARELRFAPGETVLQPQDGPVSRVIFLCRGSVAGGPQGEDAAGSRFVLEAGELFPVAAWLQRRAVSAPYTAIDDCRCLALSSEALQPLAQRSAVLADFLQGRMRHVLALSRQAQKTAFASQALAEQSMEARLGSLPRRALVACSATTPLLGVLQLMQQRRVGSVLVLEADGAAIGIFTRHDVLERVALSQPPMDTPIERLMTRPVHALDAAQSVQDAVLLMSRHGVRHRTRARGRDGVRA
jgi:CBS domain-containing protein